MRIAPLLLILAACASPPPPQPVPQDGMTEAEREFEEIFQARMDSARMNFTDADVAFMTGMIGHHAQALLMTALVPGRTDDPMLNTLAARIANAQRDEITLMQQWLRDRGRPVPEAHVDTASLEVHGAGHAHHMPGMLTPEQLRQLAEARGATFERLFLEFMIQHHGGAVAMVDELFATPGAGQDEDAFRLAADVRVDQVTEIRRMQSMLAQRAGS